MNLFLQPILYNPYVEMFCKRWWIDWIFYLFRCERNKEKDY